MASPPSFDSFYSSQQRSSTQGSMDNYPSNTYTSSSDQFGAIYAQQLGDEPQAMVTDEPQSLVSEEPQSMAPPPGDYTRAHPLMPNSDVERKDSVPFDPQTSSTLIASVQSQTVSPQPSPGFPSPYDQQYRQQQQQQQQYGQYSQHSTPAYATTPDFSPHRGDAGMFAQQQDATPVDYEANSRRASWNGAPPDVNHELQRVISNQGSNAGSPAPDHHSPRVASPFDHPSTEHVRSPSPYGAPVMGAPSPPVHGVHRGSAANSPSFSKPQSPPALVIPNSAPSPSLPGIMAQTAPQAQTSANGGPQSGQFGNSLFPPTNPALEHLTGMAGISPIAPNADGPMIYIQPSTPISGLKEGGGVFDAALRRAKANADNLRNSAAQQGQANGGAAQGAPANVGQQGPGGQSPATFARDAREWTQRLDLSNIDAATRRRTKSESYTSTDPTFDRAAFAAHFMEQPTGTYTNAISPGFDVNMNPPNTAPADPWRDINTWRMQAVEQSAMTVDPRALPGSEAAAQHAQQQHEQQQQQLHEMQEQQRARVEQFNQSHPTHSGQEYRSGRFSPTSMAFYQQLGLSPGNAGGQPVAQFPGDPHGSYLAPGSSGPVRRRSFAEGTVQHHAAGAGTPGYGVEFAHNGAITPPARYRGQYLQGGGGRHARASRSEDFGRPGSGSGWGMGAGGSTADFLQSITNPSDGTLLPPSMRGRSMSHSRHSSASSARSASPALSISSQGSSYSHHSHMEMPDGVQLEMFQQGHDPRGKSVAKMKVTSMATEVASQSRRTNSPIFQCPIPGCGSTFTRHFNLKGHMRSHNDERPYKCIYEGCPKSIVGFARHHDCKRHMLLHEGLRPFECDGCGKQFARLDALTRHHKSEQGQECAVSHPLPVNPDGTAMSESQYKAYRLEKLKREGKKVPPGLTTRADSSRSADVSANVSADEREDVKPDL